MDVVTRFQPRARAQSFLDRERDAMLDEQIPESGSTARRKPQRVVGAPTDPSGQFRKPSLPASATQQIASSHQRQPSGLISGVQRGPSLTSLHKRKASGVTRENTRVPSGPRDYPGSPGKRIPSNVSSNVLPTLITRRPSLLPSSTSEPFFTYDPNLTRGSFGQPSDNTSEPSTPASQRDRTNSGSLDFLPAINFDEFQTSLGTLDTGSSFRPDLLDAFPAIGGGRVLRSDTARTKQLAGQEQGNTANGTTGLSRGESFRQRLPDRSSRLPSDTKSNTSTASAAVSKSSKMKRQSTTGGFQTQVLDAQRHLPKARLDTYQPSGQDQDSQSSNARARRTTMNVITSSAQQNEKPRSNGVRQARGKSLLPPALTSDPNTPADRQTTKAAKDNQTPTSSGNRRQSIASGRISGLGARTISPTDARRKRMSVAPQQPPLPTSMKSPPTPGEDVPNNVSAQQSHAKSFELPRPIPAPSPSLIPTRKDSSSLASSSARASPSDGASAVARMGYPFTTSTPNAGGLSTKNSYSSLHNAASTMPGTSQSRVPVPKARSQQSATSTGANEESRSFSEMIPPVPAIPKGYESPKDTEASYYGHMTTSSGQGSSYFQSNETYDNEGQMLGIQAGERGRSSFDSDRARQTAARKSLVAPRNIATAAAQTQRSAAQVYEGSPESFSSMAQFRTQPDGRQNNTLQPLRLPPLNLAPMSSSNATRNSNVSQFPRPSQELDERDSHWTSGMQTPDWSRGHKTPSTPMTASKATFWKRHGDMDNKNGTMRSSTSHFSTRDNVGLNADSWLEDSDDTGSGIPIPGRQNFSRATGASRSAITPFASGSLPKGSGEFTRLRGRPSGDFADEGYFLGNPAGSYDGLRLAKANTFNSRPSIANTFERSLSIDHMPSPANMEKTPSVIDNTDKDNSKKESGLRRKLSLGWKRSSSKTANHADHHKTDSESARNAGSMLPPRLPASAAFTGDGSLGISTSARPSLEDGELVGLQDRLKRKNDAASKVVTSEEDDASKTAQAQAKTRSLHSERPQPVSNLRSSSWGNFNRQSGSQPKSYLTQPRSVKSENVPTTISALDKDHDDLAADDEMRRLTAKRKTVDSVAMQTDELMQRASPKSPIDLKKILHDRHNLLNIFERGEVIEYEAEGVYFTGTKNAKKIVGSLHPSSLPVDAKDTDKATKATNYGYDDDRGDYNIVFGDHLAYRYEVCDVLGKGSFGQVVRCIDHKDGGIVAVKIIRNKKRFHQQALVEVGILGKLRDWDPDSVHATLSITGSFYFRSHLCIVTPCLSLNLYELIKAHEFRGFAMPLIRRFSRQLLACLVLLQQKKVIHCDLKPENILLCNARAADIRVIDFGSSCREEEKVYTYIQSRFYRSPEVILGSSYGLGIDMWSFGCILAELLTGYPIFPGENEQDQLACIMEIFGPPDRHLVERCTRKKLFFDSVGKPRVTVSSKGRRRRPSSKTLPQALKTDDEAFIDFVSRCLRWDPERRLKPHEACSHPFILNQPLHQRPSIPDEARRAARVRSTAAVPATGSTSPVKRIQPSSGSITAATPQKASARQVPDTPQTALRAPAINTSVPQVSPAKSVNRRQSTVAASGGAAALANSRRQSSGAALAASMNSAMSKTNGASLAEKAARESMAAMAAANSANAASSAGRWRV